MYRPGGTPGGTYMIRPNHCSPITLPERIKIILSLPFLTHSTFSFSGQELVEHQQWYRLSIAIWILLGLAWMATVISVMQESYEKLAVKSPLERDKQVQMANGHEVQNGIAHITQNGIHNNYHTFS